MTMPLPSVPSDGSVPLAVPMMANTMHSSVTRNDAKMITETRLKRLRHLSQTSEDTLSKNQKDEKKRIIRLEKNRRAAAMSRRKRKIYVKNMEENSKLMARHIAILEMENAHLRAFMNLPPQGPPMRPGLPAMNPMYRMPQFQPGNMSQFMPPSASANVYSGSSIHTASTTNSLEPLSGRKRQRWNQNGNSDNDNDVDSLLKDSKSTMVPNSMDTAPLEPLPLPISGPSTAPPAIPRMLPHVPMMQHSQMAPGLGVYHSRMMGSPPQYPMVPQMPPMMAPRAHKLEQTQTTHPSSMLSPEIGKLDEIMAESLKQQPVDENRMSLATVGSITTTNCNVSADESERKSMEVEEHCNEYLDDMPPEITGPEGDLYPLSLLGDNEDMQVIEGTVDECGSVMEFPSDAKDGSRLYL